MRLGSHAYMIADPTIPLLQRLFTLMNSSAGRHSIFAGAADSALTLLEAEAVAIFEYEDVGDSFVLTTARNLSLEAQVQVMQALTRRVRGQPIWLSHPQTVGNWIEQLVAEDGGVAGSLRDLACMITIPLRASKGDLLGVMAVFYRDPLALNGRRQVLASLLAGLVGVSLENAELYEGERQRADFMAEVLRSGEVLQVDQSLDSVIQQVIGIISGTLGWQTVVVVVYDYEAGERHLAGWAAADSALYERLDRLPRSEPLSPPDPRPWRAAQFKISRSYLIDHLLPGAQDVLAALHADRYLAHLGRNGHAAVSNDRQWHASDVLIVPLTFKGADLGWMAVNAPRDLRRPTLARIQELEVFADQLAQAVINARLYNEAEHERLKLATVLDGISDGVLAFDLQDRLLFSNRAAEKMLGLKLPQIVGVPLDAVLGESPLRDYLLKGGQLEGGDLRTAELELPALNRALSVTVTPLANTGRVILMRDITYFREMERLRLELLSSLSHDLKNPLTAINVTASLIERSGTLNERQREYVNRLRDTAQRAVAMIAELLDMARLESGSRLPLAPCRLQDLIADVIEQQRVQAETRQIDLEQRIEPLPVISGDPARLEQVLANLVGNAIKYTPEGGRVRIEAAADESRITVRVIDTGIGIPEDHLPYVFDRFYRVDPLRSEGTGLGLSIVKTVIERHGGEVGVASVPGKGSTFYFSLPLPVPV